MRKQSLTLFLLLLSACGSAQGPTDSTGGSAGLGGTSGGTGGATAGGTANSGAAGDANAGEAGASANTCTYGAMPDDAVSFAFDVTGPPPSYGTPAKPNTVRGYVYVERVESKRLDFVDESGKRASLSSESPSISFDDVSIGTRFWLSAEELEQRPNPFAYQRSLSFSLRTEQDGPVLFAALRGTRNAGDTLLDAPLSIQSLCTFTEPSHFGGVSRETGKACSESVELFEAVLASEPPVHILPGTRVTASVNETSYELALWLASYARYPDFTCAPADWAPGLGLVLDVVASNWRERVADQPVELGGLPACRLGTDAPLIDIDLSALDWDRITNGAAEFAIVPKSSTGDAIEFSSPEYGTLLVTGASSEARPLLERARWFSLMDHGSVLRESEQGPALAIVYGGSLTQFQEFARRSDVLGTSIGAEPRCDWANDACPSNEGARPLALYDIVYVDDDARSVASHERATVTTGSSQFDAWVAVEPWCSEDPPVTATFVARE